MNMRLVAQKNLFQNQNYEFSISSSSIISNLQNRTHVTANTRKAQSIQVDTLQYQTCSSFYSCKCHKSAHIQTPYFLNKILGLLSINYSSAALFRQPYSKHSCRKKGRHIV